MSAAKIMPLPRTEMDALLLGRLDELTVSCESNARSKNYLGILMSVIVLILISSMIVAAIFIINPEIATLSGRPQTPREAITMDEAMLGELNPNKFLYQWRVKTQPDASRGGEPIEDELLFEESRNLNTVAMPSPSERTLDSNNNKTTEAVPSQQQLPDPMVEELKFAPLFPKLSKFEPNVTTLVSNTSLLSSIDYQGFKVSPSKRYLLIWTTRRKQFRHTFTAKYFLYDIKLDLISMLSTQQQQQQQQQRSPAATGDSASADGPAASQPVHNSYENLDSATLYLNDQDAGNEFTRFQQVEWFMSSGANDSDSLILIQNNDIYLLTNVSSAGGDGQQTTATPVRLTFTGKADEIFNGVPDWLYEEEILADTPAFQVSPKADHLAYMSFNDSQVDLMPFSIYGSGEQVIPKTRRIRYPKAGRVNPRVSVHIVASFTRPDSRQHIELQLPDGLGSRQHYINRIKWLTEESLAVTWLNRHQNESYIVVCSPSSSKSSSTLTLPLRGASSSSWKCEKNLHILADGGWLDMSDDLYPLDEQHYLALLFKDEGADVGAFKHVAKVSLTQPDTYVFLTDGRREVVAIDGVDVRKSIVYYTSTVENEPGQRQVFAAELGANSEKGGGAPKTIGCLTCGHYPEECLYNFARMSPSTNYYIFECEGPGVPRTELRSTRIYQWSESDSMWKTIREKPSSPSAAATTTTTVSELEADTGHGSLLGALLGGGSGGGGGTGGSRQPRQREEEDSSLLWSIEDNQELRDKLNNVKAMPLTMRLQVPIPNTNYSARVLVLLPPQLGATTAFKGAPMLGPGRTRPPRSARLQTGGIERAIHAHFGPDNIADYTDQLASGEQYPMVVDVYAGPGSQKVDYQFRVDFAHYMVSSRRTVYVSIDGRGSGFQGTKRLYELYHKFGTVEIQDQIEVAAYLTRNLSFIDPSKVAIWGWSYGGYAAAMALAQSNERALLDLRAKMEDLKNANATTIKAGATAVTATTLTRGEPARYNNKPTAASVNPYSLPALLPLNGVFECAVSVAPVTNWIYYDTAYTERYMSSPYSNERFDSTNAGDHLFVSPSSSSPTAAQQLWSPLLERHQQEHQRELTNKWLPLNQTTIDSGIQSTPLLNALMREARLAGAAGKPLNSITMDLNDRYTTASLLEQIAHIDRKRFLVIHGTADDNVHFQQSIMLMKRLIQKNVMFETRLYPDQDHGIANKADKLHLGATLANFFADCFDMAY